MAVRFEGREARGTRLQLRWLCAEVGLLEKDVFAVEQALRQVGVKKDNSTVFSPYSTHYYCSLCGRWVPRDRAARDAKGRPLCPRCLRYLRTRPRNRKSARSRGEADWLPGCYGFYGQPVEPWSCEACPLVKACRGEGV